MIVDDKTIIIKMRPGALLGRDRPSPALEDPSSAAIDPDPGRYVHALLQRAY